MADRLIRETDPTPGTQPGFVPQHYENDSPVKTGDKNPLPTVDANVLAKLDALNKKVDGIINGTTPASTQLKGSKVQQKKSIVLAESIAVTDTQVYYYHPSLTWVTTGASAIEEWNNYDKHQLIIYNTHDQALNAVLMIQMRSGGTRWDTMYMGKNRNKEIIEIPAGGTFRPVIIASDELRGLEGIQAYNMSICVYFSTAPTVGDFSMSLSMWCG